MKTFTYKAKNGPDEIIEGTVVAENTQEVVDRLAADGYVATLVKEEAATAGSGEKYRWQDLFGVRLKDLIYFSRQLASLIRSGIPILRSLGILSEQSRSPYLKGVINEIAEKVKNGQTLSASMRDYPNIFSSFYLAMVHAGEESGTMDVALTRVSDYYLKQSEFISKVKSALAYPILILIVGFFTLLFIFTNVIPRIIPLLLDLNVTLPLPTRILIGVSSAIRDHWFYIILFILLAVGIFLRTARTEAFKKNFSILKLRMPMVGDFVLKSEFSRFARAMETALRGGIPIIRSIDISAKIVNEPAIKECIEKGLLELESGGSFGKILKSGGIFPPFVYNLIVVGEESGHLDEALVNIASSFEADCEDYVKVLTTLMEPMMVLGIGLIVGFIVSAVLLPIFQLNIMQV